MKDLKEVNIKDIYSTEPQFVNEEGVKWWRDENLTDKANKLGGGVWYTELPNGYKARVLIINGEVVYEHTSLEAMSVHIDILLMQEVF